ncbi:MAG: ATPase, partial [Methanobrevibacter sp.]|nr:ATPase [Methanobrevibacter sp.]
KIFQEVKEKLTPETEEAPETGDETFIRNVNEYDEFEPIINETHVDYDDLHEITEDEKLRQENTRRVFNMA